MKYPLMRNNITREDLDLVIEFLKQEDPRLTNGPKVTEFEEAWSDWLGVKYSTFVSSGSAANFITLQMLKLKYPKGGEVILPPLTWISDVASVIHHGFKPIFVDIELDTLSMSTAKILESITERTIAIFVTHAQGFDGLTDELIDYLNSNDIKLIEDVCESHGAYHNDQLLGTFGFISNFSFFYAHHMSTIEGGMICTDDPDIYQWSRMLRSHGMVREATNRELRESYEAQFPELNPDFIFAAPAFNFRNTEIGGVLGLNQLLRLDQNNKQRNQNFNLLLDLLDDEIFFTDFKRQGASNYAHQIILRPDSISLVSNLMAIMTRNEIEFRRGSAGGGNQLRQPYLKSVVESGSWLKYPNTEHIHFFGFYIGNYPNMGVSEVQEIASILNSVRT